MKIEIQRISNGYLVEWDFGLFNNGYTFRKTKRLAISYSKLLLNKYDRESDE